MTDTRQRHPTRIRTFAADLEAQKNEQGVAAANGSSSDTTADHEPVPMAASPKAFKNVVPQKEAPQVVTDLPKAPAEPRNPTPTKIPPFHELQKSVAAIEEDISSDVIHPVRKVLQKKPATEPVPKKPTRPNIGYDATVITDRQSSHFKLFPAIIASLQKWFKEQKKKQAPKYTVTETERRKGVIQRATTKTATLFTADNETLREQIRRRQSQIPHRTSDGMTEVIWSPFTETGYQLLEAPDEVQPATVLYKQSRTFTVDRQQPIITNPSLVPQEEITELKPLQPFTEITQIDDRWTTDTTDIPEIIAPIPEHHTEPKPIPPQAPITETFSKRAPTPVKQHLLAGADTNTLTIILLLTISGIVATVFISRFLYSKYTEVPTAITPVLTSSQPILPATQIVGVPLTVQTLGSLPQLLTKSIASSSVGLTEYVFISSTGDEISASYLFELLGFRTIPSMRQSLLSVHFAATTNEDPSIILTFTDTDTVHGGLLTWELTMAENMRVLYNIPKEVLPDFTDEIIAGKDARVLRYNGKIVLLYSIVTDNLAIIANNQESFTRLVEASAVK